MIYTSTKKSLDKEWVDLIFEAKNLKIPYEEIMIFIKEQASLFNESTLDQEWYEMIIEARKLGISKEQIRYFFKNLSIYYS